VQLILLFSMVVVFLFLAAQYESWSLPLIIMLAVPLAHLGASARRRCAARRRSLPPDRTRHADRARPAN
jgi:Cu/Ag efflux pump CusA